MPNPFARKIKGYGALSEPETALLEDAIKLSRKVPARQDLIREGDKPGPVYVVLDGWACRYKVLPDGRRS